MGLPKGTPLRRQRSAWVTPKEIRELEKSPCCLNSKLLIKEIRQLIHERAKYHAECDRLKEQIKKLKK